MSAYLHQFLFGYYPYVCLVVFFLGSLIRFDRDQYSWRSGSSQLLRRRQLFWGSNLFHIGILLLLAGHVVGLLTPPELYESLGLTAAAKQMLAIVAGGIFGVTCFIGLTLLLARRLFDARIRKTGSATDTLILLLLYVQLILGLSTLPLSLAHADGGNMLILAEWAQRIVTFRGGAAELLEGVSWVFKTHIVVGLTIFLVFPFGRLVHIWSAPVWYVGRQGYQIARVKPWRRDLS